MSTQVVGSLLKLLIGETPSSTSIHEEVVLWEGQPGRWWSDSQQRAYDVRVRNIYWDKQELRIQFMRNPEYWRLAPSAQRTEGIMKRTSAS